VTRQARRAYLWACALDVVVRKPGNVSVASPGHGMVAEQFVTSATASGNATPRSSSSSKGSGQDDEKIIDADFKTK